MQNFVSDSRKVSSNLHAQTHELYAINPHQAVHSKRLVELLASFKKLGVKSRLTFAMYELLKYIDIFICT